jgi:cobaltochelatase CobS
MKFYEDLQEFISENVLPPYNTWGEIADFLDIKYLNGGAKESIKLKLLPTPAPAPPPPPSTGQSLEDFLIERLNGKIKTPAIDESKVIELIKEHAKGYVKETRITINDQPRATLPGRQHFAFDELVFILNTETHLYLFGDGGTGKSQLAKNLAKAMQLPFHSMSVCSQSTKSDFFGTVNLQGEVKRTPFREAFEHGGIFLLDEVDNGNPNTLNSLNSSLANDFCTFPDAMIKRHENFKVVATANTFGTGADRKFVGRNQLDEAFLDRYIRYEIPYDEDLERELWGDIAIKVQEMRRKLAGEMIILSMRKMIYCKQFIEKGMDKNRAFDIAIKNTIPFNLRNRVKDITL